MPASRQYIKNAIQTKKITASATYIHVRGDFVDLHSYPLKKLEHSVAALTAIRVAFVPHDAVRSLTETSATAAE